MAEKIEKRDGFTSRWGFILAAVGSAVGMANVWAFPFRVAKYGGAAYLIPYLICVVILALTGVVSETSFGRWAKTGPLGAVDQAMSIKTRNKVARSLGIIPVLSSFAIATGYAIITGWVIRYLVGSISGAVTSAPSAGDYFGAICGNFGSVGWHIAALVLTALMMVGGIAKSIEKLNKILIPIFFVLFIFMGVYVAFLPGAGAGYEYLFVPRMEYLLDGETWIFALGQAFFSLSLAGNGTVIYGSYLDRKEDTFGCAANIAIFDTLSALLATCVVIPAVFAFGVDPNSGPPLMFITLPVIFQQMGAFGRTFAIIFFAAIFSAAASSIVNLFETSIEMVNSKLKIKRPVAVAIVLIVSFAIGIFLENGEIIEDWMDIMSIYLCPLGALLAGICFYWILGKDKAMSEMQEGRSKKLPDWLYPLGKFGYCAIALAVIVLGIIKGGIG